LLGFSLHGKTVAGSIGLGRIGQEFARIMRRFGCWVIAYFRSRVAMPEVEGVPLDALWRQARLISPRQNWRRRQQCPTRRSYIHYAQVATIGRRLYLFHPVEDLRATFSEEYAWGSFFPG